MVYCVLIALCGCAPNLTDAQWRAIRNIHTQASPDEAFQTGLAGALNRGCLISSVDGASRHFEALRSTRIDGSFLLDWDWIGLSAEPAAGGGADVVLELRYPMDYSPRWPVTDAKKTRKVWDSFRNPEPIPEVLHRFVRAPRSRVVQDVAAAYQSCGFSSHVDEVAGVVLGAAYHESFWSDYWVNASCLVIQRSPVKTEIRLFVARTMATSCGNTSGGPADPESEDALWRAIALKLDDVIE